MDEADDDFWGAAETPVVVDVYGALEVAADGAEDDGDADIFFEDVAGGADQGAAAPADEPVEEEVDHVGVFGAQGSGGDGEDAAAAAEERRREAQRRADKDLELHLRNHVPEKGKKGKGDKGGKGKGDKGKDGKGKGDKGKDGKGKGDKGKHGKVKGDKGSKGSKEGKGNGKNKGKDSGKNNGDDDDELFHGFVYQVTPGSSSLDVKCRKVVDEFELEAVIPDWNNPSGAKVGDKISFRVEELVQEGEATPRPLASHVVVKESTAKIGSLADVRRQVEYYMSDENMKTDKFFQGIIKSTKGGWINMSVILGCRKVSQLGATTNTVLDALASSSHVECRISPPGQEAIRRKRPPPPLETGDAPCKKARVLPPTTVETEVWQEVEEVEQEVEEVELEEQAVEAEAEVAAAGVEPVVSGSDLFFAGIVADATSNESNGERAFCIACEAVKEEYGLDAFFVESQKPSNVDVGSLVVFTVPHESQAGIQPQVGFVAQLAPPGAAVLASLGVATTVSEASA